MLSLTEENYISFSYGCIRILDAYRFLGPLSLEKLVNTLKPEECVYFNQFMNVPIDNKKVIYK